MYIILEVVMERESSSRIDTAILIAILTALCYEISYYYQLVYLRHYGLPYKFIDLSISNIVNPVNTSLTMVGIGVGALIPIFRALVYWKLPNKMKNYLGPMYTIIVFVLIMMSISLIARFGSLWYVNTYVIDTTRSYWVTEQQGKPFAVIEYYKDFAITKPLNLKEESLEPGYRLIKLENLGNVKLIPFDNGLKPEIVKIANPFGECRHNLGALSDVICSLFYD